MKARVNNQERSGKHLRENQQDKRNKRKGTTKNKRAQKLIGRVLHCFGTARTLGDVVTELWSIMSSFLILYISALKLHNQEQAKHKAKPHRLWTKLLYLVTIFAHNLIILTAHDRWNILSCSMFWSFWSLIFVQGTSNRDLNVTQTWCTSADFGRHVGKPTFTEKQSILPSDTILMNNTKASESSLVA